MFKKNIQVNKLDHENIIQVGSKKETTKLVEDFYTKNPFPNYDGHLNDEFNKYIMKKVASLIEIDIK